MTTVRSIVDASLRAALALAIPINLFPVLAYWTSGKVRGQISLHGLIDAAVPPVLGWTTQHHEQHRGHG